jgi:hypothetical protein
MCFYIFYLFIECIAYGQFANTGVPNDALKTFGVYFKTSLIYLNYLYDSDNSDSGSHGQSVVKHRTAFQTLVVNIGVGRSTVR